MVVAPEISSTPDDLLLKEIVVANGFANPTQSNRCEKTPVELISMASVAEKPACVSETV